MEQIAPVITESMECRNSIQSEYDREYGVDLFRLLSMYLVIVLHLIGAGGILGEVEPLTAKYAVCHIIYCISFCCVDCFGLISGYVGAKSKYKYSNLILIWLTVVWWSIIMGLVSHFFLGVEMTNDDWLSCFFPVSNQAYWYVNSYIVLFVFMPILNYAIQHMSPKSMKQIIVFGFLIISLYQTLLRNDVLGTGTGYSAVWLIYLYVVGGYIKLYGVGNIISKKKALVGAIIMTMCTCGSRLLIETVTNMMLGEIHAGGILVKYTSPTVLGQAVFLLLFFAQVNIPHGMKRVREIILTVSPLAFSAYLIQTHPVFFNKFWLLRFHNVAA